MENYDLIINTILEEDCDFDKDILLQPLQRYMKKQLRNEAKQRAKESVAAAQTHPAGNPQANGDPEVNARGNPQAYFYSNPRGNGKKTLMTIKNWLTNSFSAKFKF